ncbi:speckle-type POZ protein-like [Musca vetustissima]|uniref:speckle-type POZ protein-like n=1 Tax=Musca vetustissima TaxID=27455 RepID=UPI002AB78E9A|nr:speckle-type POZ protein-like [Musca vetustissima]
MTSKTSSSSPSSPPAKICYLHQTLNDKKKFYNDTAWYCDRVTVARIQYLWIIENFCAIKNKVDSPVFTDETEGKIKWQIVLTKTDGQIVLLVKMVSSNQSCVKFKLKLKIVKLNGDLDDSLGKWNGNGSLQGSLIYPRKITLSDVRNPARQLLINGALQIRCELTMMVDVIHSSPWEGLHSVGSALHQRMATLLNTGKFSDVTLVVKGEELYAHKAILSLRSSVFAAMFDHESMTENKTNQILINDFEPDVIKEMLTYMYSDGAPNIHSMAGELLAAADKYDVEQLKGLCESVLNKEISNETVLPTLVLADQHSADVLKKRCFHYIKLNLSSIVFTNEWKTMLNNYQELIHEIEAYNGCLFL